MILTLLLIIPCWNNILRKTVIIVIHSELRDTLHEVDLDINLIMCRSFVVGMDGDWKVLQWAVWAINLVNKINKLTNKIISISNNSVNYSFNANLQMHEHHFRIVIPTSASCNYSMSLIDPRSYTITSSMQIQTDNMRKHQLPSSIVVLTVYSVCGLLNRKDELGHY